MKDKNCLVDFRMRKIEKDYLRSLGYNIIENVYNLDLYDEIASHIDIEYVKVDRNIVVSPKRYVEYQKELSACNNTIIKGKDNVSGVYPKDILYNVCIIGKRAIHSFKYTDPRLKEILVSNGYECIDVSQGYSNCSILVIDENSCITGDIKIAKTLLDYGIDVLFVNEPDIKLLKRTGINENNIQRMFFEYSDMSGFIGGSMACIGDTIIVFGDINNFVNKDKIVSFIESKGKKVKDFEGLNIIDYGGIMTF